MKEPCILKYLFDDPFHKSFYISLHHLRIIFSLSSRSLFAKSEGQIKKENHFNIFKGNLFAQNKFVKLNLIRTVFIIWKILFDIRKVSKNNL